MHTASIAGVEAPSVLDFGKQVLDPVALFIGRSGREISFSAACCNQDYC